MLVTTAAPTHAQSRSAQTAGAEADR